MKRIIGFILAVAIMASALCIDTFAASPSVSLSQSVSLSNTGMKPGNDAFHGNHQVRTVHTSHGDYAAYQTSESYTDAKGYTINKWVLVKIDPATSKKTIIYTGEKYYDSSQVSLIVDKNENVWAITSTSDSGRNSTYEGIDSRAHKLDAKTGEITSYESIISAGGAQDGYGYATCFYDEAKNRIIVMHAGGDYVPGQKAASFNWTIFNLETNKWQTRIRSVKIEARHCYMFGFADGKGGLIMIAQRDIKAASLGYPEVGSDEGLTREDRLYMNANGINRWAANYCWDQLDLYYFPNIVESKFSSYSVCEADYSKVTGTQAERYTLAKRLSNYYPAIQNNNGGDMLLTKTEDGKMLLHITYNKALIQAAMDRSKGSESKWYYQVWDVTDGSAGAVRLYDGIIVDEMAGESGFCFRLYEDTEKNVNLISCHNGAVTVYRTEYNGHGGYNFHKVGNTVALKNAGNLINISSGRGQSAIDNKVNILYSGNGVYNFSQLTIDPAKYEPIPCSHNNVLSESNSVAPTCTTGGLNCYVCSYCNAKTYEPIPSAGHKMVPLSAEPATCTEDGFEKWICQSGCGYTEEKVLPATGHSYADGSCTDCGEADPDFAPELSPGDLNGDGQINSIDANIIKRFLVGVVTPTAAQFAAADVNGDGAFTSIDSNALARIIAGK